MSRSENHPCRTCAWFVKRGFTVILAEFPVCTCPERLDDIEFEWCVCNRQGLNCSHYIEGKQERLELMDCEKGGDKIDWFK